MNENNLIDELQEIIYVSDLDTYDILFANSHAKRLIQNLDTATPKCYQVLQARNTPCESCINCMLRLDAFHVWEYTNESMGRHFLLKDKLINWNGKLAHLEVAIDITDKENVSLQTQQKLKTEQTVVGCIRALTEAEGLEQAVEAVLDGIGRYYQADRAYIIELDDSLTIANNTYEWCAPGIPSQMEFNQNLIVADMPFWANAMKKRALIHVWNLQELQDTFPDEYNHMKKLGVQSMLAAPFTIQDKGLGFIGVDNPSYNAEDPSLLQTLSYFVIIELQKRRMQAQLEYQSNHDALTGLYNRLQYLKYIENSEKLVLRSVGIVFCDINGLKQINDNFGHEEGDKAIVKTACTLQRCFFMGKAYRLSGDEFVVICENVSEDIFNSMVASAEQFFNSDGGRGVSVGYIWRDQNIDLHDLAREADILMYRCKQRYYEDHPDFDRRKRTPSFEQNLLDRCSDFYESVD